jgi:DNA polymerase-3 subunit delta
MEANRHHIFGVQTQLPELINICQALPFIDARRLVVIEGLLASLERRSKRGRYLENGNRQPSNLLSRWEGLALAIPKMPESTLLVFLDGPLSDRNPLLQRLRTVSKVQNLLSPNGEPLARWIKTSAQQRGASISPAAIRCLADHVGNNLWTLDREIEKLALYTAERCIDENDVKELVSKVREANIFSAVDAILDGKPDAAFRLLHQLRQDGREATSIIALIGRQLRLMALARDLYERGVPQRDWGSRLGIASQFALRKTIEQSRRYSWIDLNLRFQQLLETDLSLKQGRVEPDLALEIMVGDLALRIG